MIYYKCVTFECFRYRLLTSLAAVYDLDVGDLCL